MAAEGKCAEGRLIAPNPVDWVATEESMVEAAGVEPASETVESRETPCVVCSEVSPHALRTDKKRG